MKKAVLVWMTAAMLVLAGTAAWATAIINIDDLAEGEPVVTYSGFTPTVNTTAVEKAYLEGWLCCYINPCLHFYGIKIMEPAECGGGLSDFAVLWADGIVGDSQRFTLGFWSDGAADWNAALITWGLLLSNPNTPEIVETGTWQTLFNFPDCFIVNARSEICVVPLPGTLLLLGTGILGLVALGRRGREG